MTRVLLPVSARNPAVATTGGRQCVDHVTGILRGGPGAITFFQLNHNDDHTLQLSSVPYRPASSICTMTVCGSDVVTPLGVAQRVSTEYFCARVLPPLPPGFAMDNVLASIQRTGKRSHRLITQQGHWRGFPDEPQFDTRRKKATFAHLAPIAGAICKAATADGYTPTMQLAQRLAEDDELFDDTTLPDGCIVPMGSSQTAWEDIAAVGWYSKSHDAAHAYRVSADAMNLRARCLTLIPDAGRPANRTKSYTWHGRSSTSLYVWLYNNQCGVGAMVHGSHTTADIGTYRVGNCTSVPVVGRIRADGFARIISPWSVFSCPCFSPNHIKSAGT